MKTAFVTFSTKYFMPRAQVCIDSIKKYHPECRVICQHLEDRASPGEYVKGLPRKRLEEVQKLLENYDHVVLIGADCVLYDRLDVFLDRLCRIASIVLTPHVIDRPPNNNKYYTAGHINADLVGFNQDSGPTLEWLLEQDLESCPPEGFYEQTHLSSLPIFSNHAEICRDPGINYAYFNMHERDLYSYPGTWHVRGTTLKMAQFSGYELGKPERISKYYSGPDATGDVLKLFQEYEAAIRKNM